MTTAANTERDAVATWLAASLNRPSNAYHQWAQTATAGLALGRRFCAVRLTDELVHAVTASTSATASSALAILGGPVIHSPQGRSFYALVPSAPSADLLGPHAEYLALGCFLYVPRVGNDEPEGLASYWFIPMAKPGALCDPRRVLDLVTVGTSILDARSEQ